MGYLKIAKISLVKLKNDKHLGKSKTRTSKKYHYSPNNQGLWIAIIWNLKHAIELIVKTFGIRIDKDYLQTHNLDHLLKDLEKKFSADIKKNILSYFQSIVKKYYENEIFENKKIVSGPDRKNDVFRYADNSEKTNINFDMLDRISKKNIESIESDILFLRKLFYKKRNSIDFKPSIRKWGIKK